MSSTARMIVAVVAGLAVGFVTIFLLEMVSGMLFPPPPGVDLHDPAQLKNLMASLPIGQLVLVVIGWGIGSFDGAFLAGKIAGRGSGARAALICGVLFTLATLGNLLSLPHPIWIWIAGLALPIPIALGAGRLAVLTSRA